MTDKIAANKIAGWNEQLTSEERRQLSDALRHADTDGEPGVSAAEWTGWREAATRDGYAPSQRLRDFVEPELRKGNIVTVPAPDEPLVAGSSAGVLTSAPSGKRTAGRSIGWNDVFRDGKHPIVALTFDDGPSNDPEWGTRKVLEILRKHNVKATFYVQGSKAERYPELIRAIVADGHMLGNHTYSHQILNGKKQRGPDGKLVQVPMSKEELEAEIRKTQEAVNKALGREYPMTTMRPPCGMANSFVRSVMADMNEDVVCWSAAGVDWENFKRTPKKQSSPSNFDTVEEQRIYDNIFKKDGTNGIYRAGGALLLHDSIANTVRILDRTIGDMKADGVVLVTVGALLESKYGGGQTRTIDISITTFTHAPAHDAFPMSTSNLPKAHSRWTGDGGACAIHGSRSSPRSRRVETGSSWSPGSEPTAQSAAPDCLSVRRSSESVLRARLR